MRQILKHTLERLKTAISGLRAWVPRHYGQVGLLIIGGVGLCVTFLSLQPLYTRSQSSVTNGVYYHGKGSAGLTKVQITVERRETTDLYRLVLQLSRDANGRITIWLPRSFRRLPNESLNRNVSFAESWRRDESTIFAYDIRRSEDGLYQFWQEFEAELFPTESREVAFRVLVDFLPGTEVPVELWVRGLEGSDAVRVEPEPKFISTFALGFDLNPHISQKYGRLWSSVSFDLYDRYSSYDRDFWILIGGTLIGIFSSVVMSVLVAFVEYFEHYLTKPEA